MKKQSQHSFTSRYLFLILLFVLPIVANAQCAMCRAVLETEDGGIKAESVNDGITYLMVFPYLLVGTVGYLVYRMRKKVKV